MGGIAVVVWILALVLGVVGVARAALPLGTFRESGATVGFTSGVAPGPDGNMWFTDSYTPTGAADVGFATPSGQITEFRVADYSSPTGIVTGPDGNIWFTERGRIGVTLGGLFTEFLAPMNPAGIVTGPDGNLWFASTAGVIGRITPDGALTTFPVPGGATSFPWGIAVGSDRNLWFTEFSGDAVGRITPSGAITEFRIPTADSEPMGIAPGPDGNLWFTEFNANKIGQITPTGAITEFRIPTANSQPMGIAPGQDDSMWFTESNANKIGRITITAEITEFTFPDPHSEPAGIAPGPDGNMWFGLSGSLALGLVGTGAPGPSLTGPVVWPAALSGTATAGDAQMCQGATWATWVQQPSLSVFRFDGYQWFRDGSPILLARSQSYTPMAEDVGHQLSCRVTATYPLLGVTVAATSPAVTIGSGLKGGRPPVKIELKRCIKITKIVVRKVHGQARKVKVPGHRCTTRRFSAVLTFTITKADRATLTAGGRLYATGSLRDGRLLLIAMRLVHKGLYSLTVTRRRGHRTIVVGRQRISVP
jgi:streptogramin lyase